MIESWLKTRALLAQSAEERFYGDLTNLNKAVAAIAVAVDGLSMATPEDFLDFICPPDHPDPSMGKESTCALTVMAVWRSLGVADDELWRKYEYNPAHHAYGAVSDVLAIGQRHGCAYTAKEFVDLDERVLAIGDVIIATNPEHVFTMLKNHEEDGTVVLPCLHGGQKAGTLQLINVHSSKLLIDKHGVTYLDSFGGHRPVSHVVKTSMLGRTTAATLPPNWDA